MNQLVRTCVVLILASILTGVDLRVVADDATSTTERQAILKEMRSAVRAMTVSEQVGDAIVSAKVVTEPIFRYSDEQRQIRDATMWVWTVDGRPVSLLKFERYGFEDPQNHWLFNVTSTTQNTLDVKWQFDRSFTSKKPGFSFQPLIEDGDIPKTDSARLIRLRQLARRFSATLTGVGEIDSKSEMRLLPTPLFRYASPTSKIVDGALFGFSATGTNPDVILAIQWRGEESASAHCEFALTGMTSGGVEVRLDEQPVWNQPSLVGQGQVFDAWTWFFSERAM